MNASSSRPLVQQSAPEIHSFLTAIFITRAEIKRQSLANAKLSAMMMVMMISAVL